MTTEARSDLFPLPKGMKIRTKKFGAKPVTDFVSVNGDWAGAADARPRLRIFWEDKPLGLTVVMQEMENGRLTADVFCADAGLLGKGAVSVGLCGATTADNLIRKTIPLAAPEQNGCKGSADFGLLSDAVTALGTKLFLVIILLV